jgi:hypothetical protein
LFHGDPHRWADSILYRPRDARAAAFRSGCAISRRAGSGHLYSDSTERQARSPCHCHTDAAERGQ